MLFPEVDDFHLSFRLRCDQRDLVFSEDLVFHTLELPKYEVPGDNRGLQAPLEKWLYFLKRAEHLDAQELADRLVHEEFREAAGVLEMISQTPEDRQFYEARLKFLHDEEARLVAAREEGALTGKIQLLQQLLGEQETSLEVLLQRSSDVSGMLADLQQQLRSRGI